MKTIAGIAGLALALLSSPHPLSETGLRESAGVAQAAAPLAPRDDPDNVEGEDPPVPDGVTDPPEEDPGE